MTAPALIDLFVPLDVPSQNARERWHWTRQRAEVRTWLFYFQAFTEPSQRATGKRTVHIKSYRRQRCRDHANLVGGCKSLLDGLVRAGLLVDDSIAMMDAIYEQDVVSAAPGRRPCTRIIIEDMPITVVGDPVAVLNPRSISRSDNDASPRFTGTARATFGAKD